MLNAREKATLAAVARVMVAPGGSIPYGADDLGLVDALIAEVDAYPHRARRRTRWLLAATELIPFVSGHRQRFTSLAPEEQHAVLEENGRHKRSPLRRLIVSYLKQLVYSAYISCPQIEDVVGYRYECVKPRTGISGDRTHH